MGIEMKTFLLIVLVCVTLSCKNKTYTNNYKELKIDLEQSTPKLELTKIAKNPIFIKLHTDSLFLIGDIRNIVCNNKIYVQNFQKILVFNFDGSPAYSINNRGKARGEYYEINDFFVDTVNNIVEVWDRVKHKMFIYDDKTGSFLRNYKLDLDARYFKKLGETYFFHSDAAYANEGVKAHKIYCVNPDGKIINKYLNSDHAKLYPFNTHEFISAYNGSIYCDDAPLSKIYKITNKDCKLVYTIDINNNTMTEEAFLSMGQLRAHDRFEKLRSKYDFSTGQTNVYKYGVKLNIRGNDNGYFCFYNPKNDHYYLSSKIFEDTYLKIPIWYANICNDKLICQIPSYKIISSNIDFGALAKINPELYKKIKTLSKFDNPILIISDLKDF